MTDETREPEVCLHAWRTTEDGGAEYTDGLAVDGWSVYVRVADPRGDHYPFDTNEERDFETYEAAIAYAETLASDIGARLFEY
jgi:hypothetical protein